MEQSPRSKRPHGPGEKPPTDGNPYSEQGGKVPQQGPAAKGPQVPALDFRDGKHQGGVQSGGESKATSRPAPDYAGSPGYAAKDSSDAKKTGGYAERFENDRGGNS